ncbi:bacillithiol system redox-active protein YtxJ [Myroides ceti]|uniref:Bacillithiol system redox-active protein YtxJ n=1 Tax=Paenimyroides ceti TaxID=395087 RepID=A0ABT8CP61_9FLAO|nr:bacillithiol system redox-active protein YtxJ [Paenimyroides ceti]MDN3706258.1 bacillithiol system redox-active protein YtxJ [Paenimyroides ceti]
MKWIELTRQEQLEELTAMSKTQPVLIFKHSTRCIISKMALKNFESEFDLEGKIIPYFLDLIANRALSNAIADDFNVQHQSPQLLVIKNAEVVYHESHEGIDASILKEYI